ncbi:MAG: hypothetical protein ACI4DK_16755 [Lachnospiraceae bacterium]
MQMQMTEKDKKLIVFLAIFVILVAGGYWGIYPVVSNIFSVQEQIEDEKALQDMNMVKMAQTPLLVADNEQVETEMAALKESFFPVMSSAQVDKYMTGLILDYQLYAYDLSISMPQEEAANEPYQFSEKAVLEEMEEYTDSQEDSAVDTEEDDDFMSETPVFEEDVASGIYKVGVTVRVGGDKANIQRMIDDMSLSKQKLHLLSYNWDEESSISFAEDGTYDVNTNCTLTMSMNLYMCEE